MRFSSIIRLCCVGLSLGWAATAWSGAPYELAVDPSLMDVDAFFSGGQVTISGEIPAADEVAIEVTGPEVSQLYDVKGRIGPFWMTREKVQLENTPDLYMLLLPQGKDWEQAAGAMGLGVAHLKQQIAIGPSELPSEDIFTMFLSLKSSEGLYGEAPGAVMYTAGAGGRKRFAASYRFPSSTQAGTYTVKATCIENGTGVRELSQTVTVRETGFVKLVNELASTHRLTYGILAVVIALLAGSITGVVFKRGGSH